MKCEADQRWAKRAIGFQHFDQIPAHVIEAFTAAFRSVDLFEYFNQMVRGAIGRPLPICAMV